LASAATFALELLIAAYAASIVLWCLGGVLDLGALTPDRAEKPLLVLLIVIPLRFAIGGRSRPLDAVARRAMPWVDRARAAAAHVPPAVVDAAFAVVVTQTVAFGIGFIANLLFAPSRARGFDMPFHYQRFAEIFAAWDSGWYFDIARRGYYWSADGQSSVAFFPLYPMLTRAVAWPFGGSDKAIWTAGIAISCTAFVLALIALHRFTERVCGDREAARRTVLYVAIFPFSLFFTRVYAEALFLLTSVLAVSRAHEGRWWRAGAWGALAVLTRPNGVLVGLPLGLLALARRPGWRTVASRAAALLPLPLAFAGYCAFVYSLSGDPLGWLSAEAHWGYSIGHPPWQLLLSMLGRLLKHGPYDYFFLSKLAPFRLFHGVTALVFLVLTPAIFKRFGAALGSYVLVSLLVPLSGNALEGVGRYASVLFPVFMLVGSAKSPRLHEALLITASLLLALFVCLFVTLRPIY
jgi:hypothetical protein